MKSIAITGINGFIGSKVAARLLEKGYNVLGLSIEDKPVIQHTNMAYFQVDLTDWEKVKLIFRDNKIDILLHFAAIAHKIKGTKIPDETYKRVNYLASKNLFNCAYEKEAGVFFASSVDVYGASKERVWSENVVPKPVGIYAKTKYQAECNLKELYREKEDRYLIGRFAPVYSPENMKDVNKRFYIKYPSIAINLGSRYNYSFLSLENLVNFVVWWVVSEIIDNNVMNLCDKEVINSNAFISSEKTGGRAKYTITMPYFFFRIFTWLSNRLLYFESKSEIGFSLIKLFDPRHIDRTKMNFFFKESNQI